MSKLDLSIVIKFIDKATQPIRQFQQNVQNTNQSIDRLTQSVDRLERGLNKNSFNRFSRNLSTVSSEATTHASALDTMHSGYDRVAHVLDTVKQKTQSWSDTLKANRVQMREEIKSIGLSTLSFGLAASIPVKAFADAEDASTKLKVSMMDATGKVAPEFEKINDLATKLGTKLPGTNADFQLMMANLVQQGISFKSILGGTGEAAGNLAVLLKMPFDQAATFAAKMQDATQTAEKDMLSLMDTIQRTAYLGVDPTNMLNGFAKLGAGMKIIKQAGLEGSKAMAPLLVMADQSGMTDLASAGNAYSKTFKAMLDQTKINKALKGTGLNLDFSDGKGEFGGLSKMFKELDKLKGFSTQKRTGIISDIFGNDAENMQVLNLLIDKGQKGYDETIAKMQRQADLQTRINELLGTLSAIWDQAKGAITNVMVDIVKAIAPDLKLYAGKISEIAEKISAWAKANPQLIRTIANIAMKLLMFKVAMLSVRYTGNLLFGTIFSMVAGITKFALIMWVAKKAADKFGIGLPTRFNLISKGVRYLGQAFIFLSRQALPLLIAGIRTLSIALLSNPLTWIIAAVAALAFVIWKYWEPIKAFFKGFWDGLKIGLSPLFDTLSSAFNSMKTALAPLLPIWNALVTAFNWVKDAISGLFTPFQATNAQLQTATANGKSFGMALGTILGIIGTIIVKIIEFGATLFSIVGTAIGNTVGFIVVNFGKVLTFFSNIWTQIKNAFRGGIAGISALIFNWSPLGLFYSAFAAVLKWFGVDLPSKFTGFGSMILEGLKNGILSKVQAVKDALSNAVTGVIDKAKSILDIHSPSRVFAQIGDFTMQGMALGITNNQALPAMATSTATNSVIKAAKPIAPVRTITAPNGRNTTYIPNSGDINITIHVKEGSVVKGTAEALRQELKKVAQEERNARRKLLTDTE
ncbi:phage tail tape measure protein [Acinetobacter bereziniae]|uniref:phage tail tape measure protein n=1 Tax=Acinetobacter bereziniae TaxID=106648 RepID=UPI0025757DAD|nr:phage tail tape measure protein [Acinetobacter bereziniae]MDM1784255.1 phage tail tape measure protein [Acinetobacter bereziniae]